MNLFEDILTYIRSGVSGNDPYIKSFSEAEFDPKSVPPWVKNVVTYRNPDTGVMYYTYRESPEDYERWQKTQAKKKIVHIEGYETVKFPLSRGMINKILVAEKELVKKGQTIMIGLYYGSEFEIKASYTGYIKSIKCDTYWMYEEGDVLAVIEITRR